MIDNECIHLLAKECSTLLPFGQRVQRLCCKACHWPMKVVGAHCEPKEKIEFDEYENFLYDWGN